MSINEKRLREALEKCKSLVAGDVDPRWSDQHSIYNTRLLIADVCDRALAATTQAQDEPAQPVAWRHDGNGSV